MKRCAICGKKLWFWQKKRGITWPIHWHCRWDLPKERFYPIIRKTLDDLHKSGALTEMILHRNATWEKAMENIRKRHETP